jgi:hypothetical protein
MGVEALMAYGPEKADAKAHATAAQIWAVLLGLVCYPEYYQTRRTEGIIPSYAI